MRFFYLLLAAGSVALASGVLEAAPCDAAFTRSYAPYAHAVDSLRPDKPGALRVFDSNGASYSAAQALWMKGQVRAIDRACVREDILEASRRFDSLRTLIGSLTN